MNRTKIEWTDYTWNPITGCKHGCWYCYAKKLTQRFKKVFPNGFEPTFYPERLKEPYKVKKPSKILDLNLMFVVCLNHHMPILLKLVFLCVCAQCSKV